MVKHSGRVETRDQLEETLRETFSREDLAVYADLLLTDGDPRGELIALDLDPQPRSAWYERRRAAMTAWLGAKLSGPALHRVKLGFLETEADKVGIELVRSPAGGYL